MSASNRNGAFLSTVDAKSKALILHAIAERNGITPEDALEEVLDKDAENLLDYLVEPQRSATSVLMQRHGMR